MKLGFVGYGNMASVILNGILEKALVPASSIWVCEQDATKQRQAAALGMNLSKIEDLPNIVDVIFLCVKPKDFSVVMTLINISNSRDICFVSIAAGVTLQSMADMLGNEAAIVRTLPNTPMLVGRGTTAMCKNEHVTPIQFNFVQQVFAAGGSVYQIPESDFDAVINLSGSSPAYLYYIAKTIVEHTVGTSNLDYATSLSMLCDTMAGASEMLRLPGTSPDELIRHVTSPGGTTQAALEAFDAARLAQALQQGMEACVRRAKELGNV